MCEVNYDVGNHELLSMKATLEEWSHWLEGANHPFLIITDHRNLAYLQEAKRLNPRQARLALFFYHFKFSVTYRPVSKNGKVEEYCDVPGQHCICSSVHFVKHSINAWLPHSLTESDLSVAWIIE